MISFGFNIVPQILCPGNRVHAAMIVRPLCMKSHLWKTHCSTAEMWKPGLQRPKVLSLFFNQTHYHSQWCNYMVQVALSYSNFQRIKMRKTHPVAVGAVIETSSLLFYFIFAGLWLSVNSVAFAVSLRLEEVNRGFTSNLSQDILS